MNDKKTGGDKAERKKNRNRRFHSARNIRNNGVKIQHKEVGKMNEIPRKTTSPIRQQDTNKHL
jgi:hypothetical protein